MPDLRDMLPDDVRDEVPPESDPDAVPAHVGTDQPEDDYDPGNPWWQFSQRWLEQEEQQRAADRNAWDALSDAERAELRARRLTLTERIHEQSDAAIAQAQRAGKWTAPAETNIFILRALEAERIERERNVQGERNAE